MPRIKRITTAIFCNRYKPNKEGLCVISIRVTWNGIKRNYDTGYQLSAESFDALFVARPRPDQKTTLMALNAEEQRAKDCIDSLKTGFTFALFEKSYLSNTAFSDGLKNAFDNYCNETFTPDQYSTKRSYLNARNSFEAFRPGASIGDVSPKFLQEYEYWMLSKENSISSVAIYCRSLRSVLNWLIDDGQMSRDLYPFGKARAKKYQIPTAKNPKKAMEMNDISTMFAHICEAASVDEMARDYWVFLYLANGMNMKDMLMLKWTDLSASGIKFIREKTKRTKKEVEPVQVVMQPQMMDIIRRWGNPNKGRNQHIFPHLEPGMNAEQVYKKTQLMISLVNDHLKDIAKAEGITRPVRIGEARDSFATVMKNSGAPIAMISEAMGHSSIKTTEDYLGSFETDQLQKAAAALTAFTMKAVNK